MPPEGPQSPIKVLAITPASIHFTLNADKVENSEMALSVGLRGGSSEDGKNAVVFLDVEIHHKDHKGPYALSITMRGDFEKASEGPLDWKPFVEVNGPAIIFPYVRELISNITTRTGISVVLPPMNIAAIAEAAKIQQQKK